MKGGAHEAPRYHGKEVVPQKVGWVMSRMCSCGWMVGCKGAMPESSHHWGLARCQKEGKKEWLAGTPAARSGRHLILQLGGGLHKVRGGVHLGVGIPRLPHRVSAHAIAELVKDRRLRGQMQKFKAGELPAEFSSTTLWPRPSPQR